MNVRLLLKDGVLTAKISGEIDHHSSIEVRETIDETLKKAKPYCLRLDFSGVSFMDSSGIGLILGRIKLMKFWKGNVVIAGMTKSLNKMVELSGIASLATIEEEEAG